MSILRTYRVIDTVSRRTYFTGRIKRDARRVADELMQETGRHFTVELV